MTIVEFIKEYYPNYMQSKTLEESLAEQLKNDALPYERIGYLDGELCKQVQVDEDRWVNIRDILSYPTKEDVEALQDPAFLNVWCNYMSMVTVENFDILELMKTAEKYRLLKKEGEEKLGKLNL